MAHRGGRAVPRGQNMNHERGTERPRQGPQYDDRHVHERHVHDREPRVTPKAPALHRPQRLAGRPARRHRGLRPGRAGAGLAGRLLLAAGVLFGLYLLFSGVLQLVAAFGTHVATSLRVMAFISGALSILLGLFCFRGPMQSTSCSPCGSASAGCSGASPRPWPPRPTRPCRPAAGRSSSESSVPRGDRPHRVPVHLGRRPHPRRRLLAHRGRRHGNRHGVRDPRPRQAHPGRRLTAPPTTRRRVHAVRQLRASP